MQDMLGAELNFESSMEMFDSFSSGTAGWLNKKHSISHTDLSINSDSMEMEGIAVEVSVQQWLSLFECRCFRPTEVMISLCRLYTLMKSHQAKVIHRICNISNTLHVHTMPNHYNNTIYESLFPMLVF